MNSVIGYDVDSFLLQWFLGCRIVGKTRYLFSKPNPLEEFHKERPGGSVFRFPREDTNSDLLQYWPRASGMLAVS